MQVKWLRRALRNLEEEAAHLAPDNPQAAAALVSQADESTRLLSRHPDMGRPGRVPGTRELVLPNFSYIIPYRVREQRVEILRVFHTSRKWPPGFSGA
jgi:toxin ParE1/3/4